MPVSCYSATGRLRFDTFGTAATAVACAEAAHPAPPDEIIAAPRPSTMAPRWRGHVPAALMLCALIGLLLAGALLR